MLQNLATLVNQQDQEVLLFLCRAEALNKIPNNADAEAYALLQTEARHGCQACTHSEHSSLFFLALPRATQQMAIWHDCSFYLAGAARCHLLECVAGLVRHGSEGALEGAKRAAQVGHLGLQWSERQARCRRHLMQAPLDRHLVRMLLGQL